MMNDDGQAQICRAYLLGLQPRNLGLELRDLGLAACILGRESVVLRTEAGVLCKDFVYRVHGARVEEDGEYD